MLAQPMTELPVMMNTKEAQHLGDIWEVVGGSSKGGIISRSGKGTNARQDQQLLATGALVRQLEIDDGRLHYDLISGFGPASGWVSTQFQGKDLLVKTDFKVGAAHESNETSTAASTDGDSDSQKDSESQESEEQLQEQLQGLMDCGTSEADARDMLNMAPLPSKESKDALSNYGKRFGVRPVTQEAKMTGGYKLKLNYGMASMGAPSLGPDQGRKARAELEQHLGLKGESLEDKVAPRMKDQRNELAAAKGLKSPLGFKCGDTDGAEDVLCHMCRLPLGEKSYCRENKQVHGECMAQLMLQNMKTKMAEFTSTEVAEKQKMREHYDIGWDADKIPRNSAAVSKLAMKEVPDGPVCVILDEKNRRIRLAATTETAAAVNLEYLSISLQVRLQHGCEPIFSLDPVEAGDNESMQAKVFMPEWLEGTSVGEVLFQADYHLKELSMGEYEQPVVGMKSCFDYSEAEGFGEAWSAREWFLVRKAEVQMTTDGVLVPFVKMGVEAREQSVKGGSLLDTPVTRMDHPMVKYADAFTENFDLIAERKSVIFHLRELAKASVLAKFLVEASIDLDESLLRLSSDKLTSTSLEVPQLWNNKVRSQIQIEDQQIESSEPVVHGIYGGVQFGLDRFPDLFAPTALTRSTAPMRRAAVGLPPMSRSMAAASPFLPPPQTLAVPLAPMQAVPAPLLGTSAARAAPMIPAVATQMMAAQSGVSSEGKKWEKYAPSPDLLFYGFQFRETSEKGYMPAAEMAIMMGLASPVGSVAPAPGQGQAPDAGGFVQSAEQHSVRFAGVGRPKMRGVDLSLDQFDLGQVKRVNMEAPAAIDKCMALGDAFWSGLKEDSEVFSTEDKNLLQDLFCEALCDRRQEGDKFVPPDSSHSYVDRLRSLVKQEEMIRMRRKEQFLDEAFKMDAPGSIFPSSWTPSFQIARGRTPAHLPAEGRAQETLHRRKDYEKEASLLEEVVLKSAVPVFDNKTEDGMRFRVYRIGSLEFRSTQEMRAKEKIGAVFSIHTPMNSTRHGMRAPKMIGDHEKVTKVTEYVEKAFNGAVGNVSFYHRYYLVLETEKASQVLTEMQANGKAAWVGNEDFEVRNSLAKVTFSAQLTTGVTIADMKAIREKAMKTAAKEGISQASCKSYVRAVRDRACQ